MDESNAESDGDQKEVASLLLKRARKLGLCKEYYRALLHFKQRESRLYMMGHIETSHFPLLPLDEDGLFKDTFHQHFLTINAPNPRSARSTKPPLGAHEGAASLAPTSGSASPRHGASPAGRARPSTREAGARVLLNASDETFALPRFRPFAEFAAWAAAKQRGEASGL